MHRKQTLSLGLHCRTITAKGISRRIISELNVCWTMKRRLPILSLFRISSITDLGRSPRNPALASPRSEMEAVPKIRFARARKTNINTTISKGKERVGFSELVLGLVRKYVLYRSRITKTTAKRAKGSVQSEK